MTTPEKSNTGDIAEADVIAEYANNVYFSPNVWDLKLLFGELAALKQQINWHTSITLPWAQAKLMAYYLLINIAHRELVQGPIEIPPSMIPVEPSKPTSGNSDEENEQHRKFYEYVKQVRSMLLSDDHDRRSG